MKTEAIFKGRDGSEGFVNGQIYTLMVWATFGDTYVHVSHQQNYVAYGSFKAFTDNWELV